jgi:long-chain acyl-CoA synthetase
VAGHIPEAKTLSEEILTDHVESVPAADVAGDDICIVLFTSGTTGTPKPVPFSHAVLGGRVKQFAAPDPSAPTLVSISCVPFHHVAGLVGVFVGLAGGNTVVLQRRFDAAAWLRLVAERHVSRIFLVPTMLHRILDHPDVSKTDLSSVQLVTYGAAPASPELIARARAFFPPSTVFLQVFGQTETLGGVVALGPGDEVAAAKGSVGKAMPGVDVRVVDPLTGEDVADGEVGEFWARAPHTASPDWVRSGDLVRRDADGYIYAVGRMSDVINRGGEKIDPVEVEAALRAHGNVVDVAVAGFPDPDLGEAVGAVVVVHGPLDEEGLRDVVRARLASYKVPARFVFVDEIPLTELGKVSRRELKRLLADG